MKRGEIWAVDFNPTIGAEINKIRPAVIISDDNIGILPLKIIIPITDWKLEFTNYSWMTKIQPSKINNLSKNSCADSFQVKSLSINRFIHKIGKVTKEEIEEIVAGVGICVDFK
ncbi:MAG: mazF [Ignavibacteria bacterium]|nr:mazF [Ignavibacteria bacterium]